MYTVTHKQQIEGNNDSSGKINSDTHDSNPNKYKIDRQPTLRVRYVAKRTTPRRDVKLEPRQ